MAKTKSKKSKVYFCRTLVYDSKKAQKKNEPNVIELDQFEDDLLSYENNFPIKDIGDNENYVIRELEKKSNYWTGSFARLDDEPPTLYDSVTKKESSVPLVDENGNPKYVQEKTYFLYIPKVDILVFMINMKAGTETKLALYLGEILNKFINILRIDDAEYRDRIFGGPIYEVRTTVAYVPENGGKITPSLFKEKNKPNINIGTAQVIIQAPKGQSLGADTIKEAKNLYNSGASKMWIRKMADQDAINLLKPSIRSEVLLEKTSTGQLIYTGIYGKLLDAYQRIEADIFDE